MTKIEVLGNDGKTWYLWLNDVSDVLKELGRALKVYDVARVNNEYTVTKKDLYM